MFLTSMQCLCFKSEIFYFYMNFIKGFKIHSSAILIQTLKVGQFIHQSYHNFKNFILNTETKYQYMAWKFTCK